MGRQIAQTVAARRQGTTEFVGSLLALALLSACAQPLSYDRPTFNFAPGWQVKTAGAQRLLDNTAWWRGLKDPTLDQLIALTLSGNPTLAAARARAAAATAATGAVPGALTLTSGVSLQAQGGNGQPDIRETRADLGLEALFDPGRGREAERAAAAARNDEAAAAAAGAQLFLIGQMAETYLSFRHAQRRLELAEAETARARKTLALAQQLAAAGSSTRVETLRSEARLAELAADLPALQAAVTAGRHSIAVLAGRNPSTLPPDIEAALAVRRMQPQAKLVPDPGIPADLLRNRPDIRAAEAAYNAARADLGQARAALYPRLSLSGEIEIGGRAGLGGDGRVTNYIFGPSLRLPALPSGPVSARIAAGHARVTAAYADWTAAVLQATLEVETALLDYRAAASAEAAADRAAGLYAEALDLTRDLAGQNEATLSDLIDAEEALARAETRQAATRFARGLAFVRLNIRLGAGGDVSKPSPIVAAAP